MALRTLLTVVLLAIAATPCVLAWAPVQKTMLYTTRVRRRHPITTFQKFAASACSHQSSRLDMTVDEHSDKETQEQSTSLDARPTGNDNNNDRSLSRTIILAVPLFCKFVVILMIKFVTDLIVFPLLWTYRLVRMAKRKVFGKKKKVDDGFNEKINGDTGNSVSI
jgi:hypothetical protein